MRVNTEHPVLRAANGLLADQDWRAYRRISRAVRPRAVTVCHETAAPGQASQVSGVLDLPDAAQWEAWLAAEHEVRTEAWLRIARAHSGIVSVTPAEALDVALCFGWIDGLRRACDDVSFLQRYSRRRPGSSWSTANVAKAKALAGGIRIAARRRGPARSRLRAARQVRPVRRDPAAARGPHRANARENPGPGSRPTGRSELTHMTAARAASPRAARRCSPGGGYGAETGVGRIALLH
jgi:hypothetical protein